MCQIILVYGAILLHVIWQRRKSLLHLRSIQYINTAGYSPWSGKWLAYYRVGYPPSVCVFVRCVRSLQPYSDAYWPGRATPPSTPEFAQCCIASIILNFVDRHQRSENTSNDYILYATPFYIYMLIYIPYTQTYNYRSIDCTEIILLCI